MGKKGSFAQGQGRELREPVPLHEQRHGKTGDKTWCMLQTRMKRIAQCTKQVLQNIKYATNVHRGGSCSKDIYDFFSEAEPGSLDPVSR